MDCVNCTSKKIRQDLPTQQSSAALHHTHWGHSNRSVISVHRGLGQTCWAEMRATVSSWPYMGLFPHILQLSSWQRSVSSSVCTFLPWHTATYVSVVCVFVCVWGHNRAATYYLYQATPDPWDLLDHDSIKIKSVTVISAMQCRDPTSFVSPHNAL